MDVFECVFLKKFKSTNIEILSDGNNICAFFPLGLQSILLAHPDSLVQPLEPVFSLHLDNECGNNSVDFCLVTTTSFCDFVLKLVDKHCPLHSTQFKVLSFAISQNRPLSKPACNLISPVPQWQL